MYSRNMEKLFLYVTHEGGWKLDFKDEIVSVTINYGNTSPETMESTITRPIENAVARVSGIDYLQSNSFQGQTVVRAQFKYGTDINVATNDIERFRSLVEG